MEFTSWASRVFLQASDMVFGQERTDKGMEDTVFNMITNDPQGAIAMVVIGGSPESSRPDMIKVFVDGFIKGVEEENSIPLSMRPRAEAAARRALMRALEVRVS